jgi:predicted metal-dependent enzyme (double-stranded beta helix superfamily)
MYPRQKELTKRIQETPTHFKWSLWESSNREFHVYVHQYKPPQNLQCGYALSVHNHRYWFTSLMLRGAFQHLRYEIPKDAAGEFDVSGARIVDEVAVKAGDVYQLSLGEVHSVRDIQEETRTWWYKQSQNGCGVRHFCWNSDDTSRWYRAKSRPTYCFNRCDSLL